MSFLKKLSSQTLIYGLSSVVGRFLNYLLVPLYTYKFSTLEYGIVTEIYAFAGFLIVLLTYGMETAFFRFNEKYKGTDIAYSSGLWSLIATSIAFFLLVYSFLDPISGFLNYNGNQHYILMLAGIMAMDAMTALPFAKLREQERAVRFATIKLVNIFVNIGLNLALILAFPKLFNVPPVIDSIFIANLVASGVTILLLMPEFSLLRTGFSVKYYREMIIYALPLMVAGMAGMVNEMLDRTLLRRLLPYSEEVNTRLLGIYGATYKLSILMSLFAQAFRYAAEPVFFRKAEHQDAPQFYAMILKYFTYLGAMVFLFISLFIEQIKFFLGSEFHEGIAIVPVLLMANLFLAVQLNLSIWYKIRDMTKIGAMIAIAGAIVTITLNVLWIPRFGYYGSAWATLICYFFMSVLTYLLGKRIYPIPYDLKRIFFSIATAILFFLLYKLFTNMFELSLISEIITNVIFLLVYAGMVYMMDMRNINHDLGLKSQ